MNAAYVSSRSIFIVWKRSFLYDKKVYALLVFPRNHSPYTFLFPFLNFFILKKRNLILRAGFICNDFPGKTQRNIM